MREFGFWQTQLTPKGLLSQNPGPSAEVQCASEGGGCVVVGNMAGCLGALAVTTECESVVNLEQVPISCWDDESRSRLCPPRALVHGTGLSRA